MPDQPDDLPAPPASTVELQDPFLSLMDGATSHVPALPPEFAEDQEVASDPELSIEERLEAYEDIYESEVGDTTMTRARNLEREIGLRQIFLKFEGSNPTGTQKDRIAFTQVMDAIRRGFDAITVATCGNYGVAMALAASTAGLRCIVYIPDTYRTKRIKEIESYNVEIVRVPGDYEQAVAISQERARHDDIFDANPGGANTVLQLSAYGQIAYEIYDELRDAPAAVAVPVSNGTTLAGIYKGFVSLYRRGKTSRLPRMIAGSAYRKNPIVRAFVKNLDRCADLDPKTIHETKTNEPLINWHSIDGDLALDAIRSTNGWAADASDKSLQTYSRLIREKEGLNVLPASTAGLIPLIERHRKETLPGGRYVIVFTGRKS